MKIKNWSRFQHFKDRRPPWIKLYRDILDDREWHKLDGESAKMLVSLWLIGSEDSGELPDVEELAFRMRVDEKRVKECLKRLSHWLITDRYQDDIALSQKISVAEIKEPLREREEKETEREEEKETEKEIVDFFDVAWSAYPKRPGANKTLARKAWDARLKDGASPEEMIDGVYAYANYCQVMATDPQYIKQASTFFGPGEHYKSDWTPTQKVNGNGSKFDIIAETTAKLTGRYRDSSVIDGIAVQVD